MFLKGKIKSFSTSRGFGFIEVEGDIDDVFFHIKDLPQHNIEPKLGEALQFEPYRVCRRVNILRDYPDDKIKIYP
ncbi:cold shock domain-containing protein [Acinetobacter johnsonii]|uniref:cold shock domain-containing protein n=1 Tax=Acinetobacter johnsonii TaxID=40214 RepID=UPI003AF47289